MPQATGFAVLLTATINPGLYSTAVFRNNPSLRTEDYVTSLTFWENLHDERIKTVIFCDNSGSNIDAIKELCRSFSMPIEFLVFDGNTKPSGVHYGYSELGILDHVVSNSTTINSFTHFIKATGRLTYPNISRLLDTLPENFDAAVDHRKAYKNEDGHFLRARTQLMIFSLSFYKMNLLQRRREMLGNFSHIEEFVAAKLATLEVTSKIIRRFAVELFISGQSGHKNNSYNSLRNRLKFNLRRIARVIIPDVWL